MKILIDKITNKVINSGKEIIPSSEQYVIDRDVDLSTWKDYEIFYNPIRGTFEKGENKLFVKWLEEQNK